MTRYNKFWVALLMAAFAFIRAYTGFDFGFDEGTANTVIAAATAFLVWLVPNKPFFGRSGG